MAEATVRNAASVLEQAITCTFCNQIYDTPLLLPCLHSFCLKCIREIIKRAQYFSYDKKVTAFNCPSCRESTPIPENGPGEFPVNSAFTKIRDKVLPACKAAKDRDCGLCDDKDLALWRCMDCEPRPVNLCMRCLKIHNDEVPEHRNILIINPDKGDAEDLPTERKEYCPKHPGRELRIFCETCEEALCTDCYVSRHVGHVYDDLDLVAKEARKTIKATVKKLKQKKAQKEAEMEALVKEEQLLLLNRDRALKQIRNQRKRAMKQVEDHYENIKAEAREKSEANKRHLEKTKERLERCAASARDLLAHGDDIAHRQGEVENLLNTHHELTAEMAPERLAAKLHDLTFTPGDPDAMAREIVGGTWEKVPLHPQNHQGQKIERV